MDLNVLVRGLWDRIGGWSLIALGSVFIVGGWLGVSDTVLPSEQIPYVVSGGVGGLALIGVGGTLVIAAGLRDEWAQLSELEALLQGEQAAMGAPEDPVPEHSNGDARRRPAPLRAAK